MAKHKKAGKTDSNQSKRTARNKIRKIEKEIVRIEPLPSARPAVEALQTRLEYWKKFA